MKKKTFEMLFGDDKIELLPKGHPDRIRYGVTKELIGKLARSSKP